jgi:hypothetical protein
VAEEVESGASVHLSHDSLGASVGAFGTSDISRSPSGSRSAVWSVLIIMVPIRCVATRPYARVCPHVRTNL